MTSTTAQRGVEDVERSGPGAGRPSRRGEPAAMLIGLLGASFVLIYVVIALLRIRHPYELEWMEGAMVDHVGVVLDGQGLYGPPSFRFTPFIYTPLYYYAAAGLAWVTGNGFVPLRLLSFVASLVAFVAVGRLVHQEVGDRWAAMAGAGLFAACFQLGGAWFDLARVDSLFLALLFGGLVLARRATTWRQFATAGAILSLAFLTKQSALLPALAVIPWSWRSGRRHLAGFVTALALGIGGSTVVFDGLSDGWYSSYVFDLPARHRILDAVWITFWTDDLLRALGIAVIVSVILLVVRRREAPVRWFLLPVVAGLLLSAYSSRLHSGGYDNVLLPAYGGIAVLFGIAVADVHRWRPATPWPRQVAMAACAAQLALLAYDPSAHVPSEHDRRAGDRLTAELAALEGSVYLPGHGWYLPREGRQRWAHGAAMSDVMRAPGSRGRAQLAEELRGAVAREAFDYVVVDSTVRYSMLPSNFRQHYRIVSRLGDRKADLALPITGKRTAPETVWAPIAAQDRAPTSE